MNQKINDENMLENQMNKTFHDLFTLLYISTIEVKESEALTMKCYVIFS